MQKTAYEMRISDWTSDVCSSDLHHLQLRMQVGRRRRVGHVAMARCYGVRRLGEEEGRLAVRIMAHFAGVRRIVAADAEDAADREGPAADDRDGRSEEHTSELQSIMRKSYAVFCLKKKKTHRPKSTRTQ